MDTPLGALSGGAGGMASAVSDIIEQRLRQAQVANQAAAVRAQQAETQRQHMADEAERQQREQDVVAFQQGTLADRAAQRGETANKDFVTQHNLLPIGTPTDPAYRDRAARAGIPAGAFTAYQPPSMGMSTPQGEVGPSDEQVGGLTRGTQPQIETARKDMQAETDRQQAQIDRATNQGILATIAGQRANDAHELGMMRLEMMRGNAEKKASTVNVSAAGKSALTAINQAAPMTDQVIAAIEKQYPDIATNPEKYNGLAAKADAQWGKMMYQLGFASDDEPRRQITSLLQPIQAGQYMRSSRSRQMLELALGHMADQGQTIGAQYQRLKVLRGLMPEMYQGVVQSEQPVDPANPLANSYFGRDVATAPAGGGRSGGPGAGLAPATGGPASNEGWIDVPDPSGGPPMRVRKKPQ